MLGFVKCHDAIAAIIFSFRFTPYINSGTITDLELVTPHWLPEHQESTAKKDEYLRPVDVSLQKKKRKKKLSRDLCLLWRNQVLDVSCVQTSQLRAC